jgi:hypothetical protein
MAGNCGKITDDIFNNCDETLIGGVRDRLILFNTDDIDNGSITRNTSNGQIIEGITLPSSPQARGFVFEGQNNSIDASTSLSKGRYSVGYIHRLVFRIFTNSPAVKEQLEAMAKGKVVAIVQNNFQGASGQGAFEISGLEAGLEVIELTSDKSDADTQGAYVVTLSTNEQFREGHLPATAFLTDFETTRDWIEALL